MPAKQRIPRIEVAVANQQSALEVDIEQLRLVVTQIVGDAGFLHAAISIAIVDDATIHRLNNEFLRHDYPTDVLSFVLELADGYLEGELILGAEQAVRIGAEHGWPGEHELLLYAIHGALHLVGHDDQDEASCRQMRAAENRYLASCGLVQPGSAYSS